MGRSVPSRRGRSVFLCSRELGCPINLAFTTRLHNYFLANRWTFRDAGAADAIVIVSCSTLPELRRAVAAAARYYANRYPSKKTIVTGCFVGADMVRARNVTYIPIARAERFDELFHAAIPLHRIAAASTREEDAQVRAQRGDRAVFETPYNVMVSTGCLNHCAFCIQKNIFPAVKSAPLADIASACREGLRKGYRSFAFGGADIASYGQDLGCDVTDLFAMLFDKAFKGRPELVVGFKGLEPSGFIRHFPGLKKFFETGRVSWICLPIQSGSDRVLRSMGRKYRVADVLKVVAELRRMAPALRIDTDLLLCYPTETRKDFEASLALRGRFDHVQMLAFQRHRETRAAALRDVFSAAEKGRRLRVIKALGARAAAERRPECKSRCEVRLPSPLGASGFCVLDTRRHDVIY